MSQEIALHDLIDYIRDELLTPYRADSREKMYPFLFIDEVELEISVAITSGVAGSGKVSVQVIEVGSSIEKTHEQGHTMRIKMSPLVTKEEIRKQLQEDGTWEPISQISRIVTLKESKQAGQEE